MRFRHKDGSTVHVSYCTNVHPAETIEGITAQLDAYAEPVRVRLGSKRLGLGLWLPAETAATLAADEGAVARLRRELSARGLETVTLNGFPYHGFHAPVVKRAVYYPDWSEPARLEYTLHLARVLAGLLPDDVTHGSVSTLPLAWRTVWTSAQRRTAARQLTALTEGLKQLAADTGKIVRVGIEPEPGCVAETVEQAVEILTGTDPEWLGVCLDACHLAVAHEDPDSALALLRSSGRAVVKLQASTALEAPEPALAGQRAALAAFAEPRFLHQTRERGPGGTVLASDDLGGALAGELPGVEPWRVHYHVPLHEEPEAPLAGTREVLRATLRGLLGGERAGTGHVEVETYTWSVLPGAREDSLVEGLAAELDWMRGELLALGLEEEDS
ncbi:MULTISPECIES: metabolite traffic protein EboE [Streptomyces]|uniref:metabolite traffic protein EboE n=1 Tax=Streptomyces TaxID=1883 RepID=UPI0023B956DD|nr:MULTISPECIES: metabolite traffic protein EboE [unclassified Streptomyces]MDT0424162.1 metabolite traffic protein EboE [Streptomyces sp. DSM 41859]WEH27190.1 metabolite traffic protein EboE [Streptomyces sp. AM 3-1-1]